MKFIFGLMLLVSFQADAMEVQNLPGQGNAHTYELGMTAATDNGCPCPNCACNTGPMLGINPDFSVIGNVGRQAPSNDSQSDK